MININLSPKVWNSVNKAIVDSNSHSFSCRTVHAAVREVQVHQPMVVLQSLRPWIPSGIRLNR